MAAEIRHGDGQLILKPEAFEAVERPVAYAMVNAILTMQLDLQKAADLRPEECQVFFVIVTATVQRFMRAPVEDESLLTRKRLPADHLGHISRRRIADTLDLPVETVRRHVERLKARGLVVESGRGKISTSGGTLERFSAQGTTLALARQFVGTVRTMERLGAVGRKPHDEG